MSKGRFEQDERVRVDAPIKFARFRAAFQGRVGRVLSDRGVWVQVDVSDPDAKHDRPQIITVQREWLGRVQ